MIARELTEFFAGFAPDGAPGRCTARERPDVPLERQRLLPPRLLGGRSASATSPTPRTRRSARDLLARRLDARSTTRGAAVLHAHDYAPGRVHAPLLRRVPRPARDDRPRRAARRALDACATCAARSRADRALDARAGLGPRRGARAGRRARASTTPAAQRLRPRSARAPHRLPRRAAARAVARGARRRAGAARGRRPPMRHGRRAAVDATRRSRASRATARRRCSTPVPGMAERERLHIAVVIPPFRRGSGGHNTIFQIAARGSSSAGHTVLDLAARPARPPRRRVAGGAARRHASSTSRRSRRRCSRASTTGTAPTSCVATGWQTVYPVAAAARLPRARLPRPRPRAGVLRHLGRVAAGPSAPTRSACTHRREPVAARPGRASATARDGDAVPARRRPRRLPPARRSRAAATPSSSTRATSRRAAPCRSGCSRSTSCTRRRPDVRIVLFGDPSPTQTPFPYEHLGVARPSELASAVLGGDRRPLPVADELLADPAGDAGLRAAVRRPRRPQRARACSAPTARSSSPSATRSRSPTRSSGCSTTRGLWERRSAEGSRSWPGHLGPTPPTQVEAGLRDALRRGSPVYAAAVWTRAPARPPLDGRPAAVGGERPRRAARRARAVAEATDRLYARLYARRRRRGRAGSSTPDERDECERSGADRRTLALDPRRSAWHRSRACSRRPGSRRDAAAGDVHAMARGPLRRRRRALLRRHDRRRACARRLLARRRHAAASTSAARPAGPCARSHAAYPRGRVARRRPQRAARSRGPPSTCPASLCDLAAGPAAGIRRRLLRPRRRDLDLVALRRARRDRAGWTRCTA